MPYAYPRRALSQLALVGFAACLNVALSAAAQAQSSERSQAQPPPIAALEPGAVAREAGTPPDEAETETGAEAGGEQDSPLVAHQRKTLQTSLEQVNKDRQEVSTLWPWLVTGIGASMVIVALILGAESSIGCGDSCKGASAVPAWLAISGTTVSTVGLIWTVNTEHHLDKIDSREYRIKSELERLEWHTTPRQQSAVGPRLSLRGSF